MRFLIFMRAHETSNNRIRQMNTMAKNPYPKNVQPMRPQPQQPPQQQGLNVLDFLKQLDRKADDMQAEVDQLRQAGLVIQTLWQQNNGLAAKLKEMLPTDPTAKATSVDTPPVDTPPVDEPTPVDETPAP